MANTNPTITTTRRRFGAALLLAALWGGALAALAAGPFAAEMLALETGPVSGDPAGIARQAERLDGALAVFRSPVLAERAALARLRLAEAYGRHSVLGRREAEQARSLARASLDQAPGNPFLWLWLSQLDAQLDGISPRSAQAWLASVRAGPFDPDLAEERLWLGLLQAQSFDEAAQSALTDQIRRVAAWRMEAVVGAAMRADSTALVRRALAANPAALSDFNGRVARYPQ